MSNKSGIKQPLGQIQERYDIKKGLSRKMAPHQNEKNTWWNVLNFRFYKQNIFTFFRKKIYSVVSPITQTLTIPSDNCLINTAPIIPPPVNAMRVHFRIDTPGGVNYVCEVSVDGGAYVSIVFDPDGPLYVAYNQIKYRATCTEDIGPGVIDHIGCGIEPFEEASDGVFSVSSSCTATGTWVSNGIFGPAQVSINGFSEGATPMGPFIDEGISTDGLFNFSASNDSQIGIGITGGFITCNPGQGTFTNIVLECIATVIP